MRTVKIKLAPTIEQENLLISISKTYIKTVNEIVSDMVEAEKALKLSSKDVDALMPSAVKSSSDSVMPKVSTRNQRNWGRFPFSGNRYVFGTIKTIPLRKTHLSFLF